MSIARQLELAVTKLRGMIRRGNTDILDGGPQVLDELDGIAQQVRGLETVAVIDPTRMPKEVPYGQTSH